MPNLTSIRVEIIKEVEERSGAGTVFLPKVLTTSIITFSAETTLSGVYYQHDIDSIENLIKESYDEAGVLHYD